MFPHYRGCDQLQMACELVMEDKTRLFAMIKEVYSAVAKAFDTNWISVESNIRRLIKATWNGDNRRKMEKLLHQRLPQPPTNSQFIAAVISYLENQP